MFEIRGAQVMRGIRCRSRKLRTRNEGGAAMVEAALVMPIIGFLIFAIIAAGLFARSYLSVQNAAAAGARAAAVGAIRSDADFMAIEAATRDLSAVPLSNIEKFIIYKANAANEPAPVVCENASVGITARCNVYQSSDLSISATAFNAASFTKDNYWDATTRNASRTGATDIVGVSITAKCGCLTQMFGYDPVITRAATVPLESQNF